MNYADGRITHALGTGAGDLVFAGHTVAHGAGLAVLPEDVYKRQGLHCIYDILCISTLSRMNCKRQPKLLCIFEKLHDCLLYTSRCV